LTTILDIRENINTLPTVVHIEPGLTDHLTLSGRVGGSRRNSRSAVIVETLPHCIVNGISATPLGWIEERSEIAAGGITYCLGGTCPYTIVDGRGEISGDIEGFEVREIRFSAHIGLSNFNWPYFKTVVSLCTSLES